MKKQVNTTKNLLLNKGCYSPKENLRIYNKWFKTPRKTFQLAKDLFSFDKKVVCDIGCAYGSNLIHCSSKSYGIEIEEYPSRFAKSIGLCVHQMDIFGDISSLTKADIVWSADTLEHLESPHIFLRKIHQLLTDEGLIILKIPTIPHHHIPLPFIRSYQKGYAYGDHINGFTCSTLRFFCERSGFKTLVSGVFLSPLFRFLNIPLITENTGQTIYVGKKIPKWHYPKNSTRIAAENDTGFVSKGLSFLDQK